MNSALLSRFDLVFILLDKPDEEMDGFLSEHVMGLHSEPISSSSSNACVTVQRDNQGNISQIPDSMEQWNNDKPLSERLKIPKKVILQSHPSSITKKVYTICKK